MFAFGLVLYLRRHEKETHVRELSGREAKAMRNVARMFSSTYEPVLCMCSVSTPPQHGQAPNQALLQPQHLCAGQTVSGAAQVADVPSHERGSRNARQEAQCA